MQTSGRVDRRRGWLGRGSARPGGLLVRLGLSAVACVVLASAAASCSLIVATSSDQCQAVDDCKSFPGLRSCTQNVCVAPTAPPACTMDVDCAMYAGASCVTGTCVKTACGADADCSSSIPGATCQSGKCVAPGCKVNADCAGEGQYFVCKKTKCIKLLSDECTTLHTTKTNPADAYNDDSAVIFGSILPTNGGSDAPFGKLLEDSIKLAIDDFGKVNGLPGLTGGANRPLVLVGCADGMNEDSALTEKAAQHLVDLGVPAIIGYAFSGNTIKVASDVTIPNNVILFSSSATSNDITNLVDHDLVWRTAPRDDFQAKALAAYYPDVEAAAKVKYPMIGTDPTTNPMKVAIVNHSDAYGSGLGDALQKILVFNGKPATDPFNANNYKRVDYGMSASPNLAKVTDVVNFAPDVIFLFGANEGPDKIFTATESQWVVPTDGHRPFWVFSDGGEDSSLWTLEER